MLEYNENNLGQSNSAFQQAKQEFSILDGNTPIYFLKIITGGVFIQVISNTGAIQVKGSITGETAEYYNLPIFELGSANPEIPITEITGTGLYLVATEILSISLNVVGGDSEGSITTVYGSNNFLGASASGGGGGGDATAANQVLQINLETDANALLINLRTLLTSLDGKDFATQVTLASILAKIIAAPSTEAKQDSLNVLITALSAKFNTLGQKTMANSQPITIASDQVFPLPTGAATEATEAAILAKIIAAPATEAKQDTGNAFLNAISLKDFATQTTLAALLAKVIAAPSTEAKQDAMVTLLTTISNKDFATQATLALLNAKFSALGQNTMANSQPVVIASNQTAVPVSSTTLSTETTLAALLAKVIASPSTEAKQDTMILNDADSVITGQAAQTSLNNNVINAVAGTGATDVNGYAQIMCQITPTGTIATGAVTFEGCNEPTFANPFTMRGVLENPPSSQISTAVTITTGTTMFLIFPVTSKYVRARISTGVTGAGGSIQCITFLQRKTSLALVANLNGVTQADAMANPTMPQVGAFASNFNSSTWDRNYGNYQTTIFTSALRAVGATNSADFTNFNACGISFFINITAVTGISTVTFKVQMKDSISGNYIDIPNATTTALAVTGQSRLTIYPGIAAVANVSVSDVLPRVFRVVATVTTTDVTFSVSAAFQN